MLTEDGRWKWPLPLPLKYVLLAENDEGEERLLAGCAEVEGLFVDPVAPPRERLVLVGCTPSGPLLTALDQRDGEERRLGGMWTEIPRDGPPEVWELVDVTVLAHGPCADDPSLVDVTIEAGVLEPDWGHEAFPVPTRFDLFQGNDTFVGSCREIDALFIERPGPEEVPMKLIGCEPTERLRALLDRRRQGWTELWALDRTGRPMAFRRLWPDVTGTQPSALGDGLIDVSLADGVWDPPAPWARPIWEDRYEGLPATTNRWARYTTEGRREWLRLGLPYGRHSMDDVSGGTHHLDGRFATDIPGLHCALSEALLGPGRYYGADWNSFTDCLYGGFGVVPPFTLVWHDADIARDALAMTFDNLTQQIPYFEEVVEFLERHGVTVVLR
ncbi:barstar family protein [Streptosporangium sp. NPDC051022]|uniref:barstar family protein n=1 Tax=Streptosporangium sp. NPDC051022 TaxID=3155752 RepID=UPI00343BA7CB